MKLRQKDTGQKENSAVICIAGMAGSGKSTLAKKIAQKYGLRYFSGGDALMALAIEEGHQPRERGWWESPDGMKFLERRAKTPSFDRAVDEKQLEMANKGNVVLDSWTMPWLLDKGFKVWLEASQETRAKRIAGRDRISFEEAFEALKRKEKETQDIYRKMYHFNLGKDFEPFHLILDIESLNAEEVFQVMCVVLDSLVFRRNGAVRRHV